MAEQRKVYCVSSQNVRQRKGMVAISPSLMQLLDFKYDFEVHKLNPSCFLS